MTYEAGDLELLVGEDNVWPAGPYDARGSEAVAFLPHSCDEWVLGMGTRAEMAAALRALIADVVAALEALTLPDDGD